MKKTYKPTGFMYILTIIFLIAILILSSIGFGFVTLWCLSVLGVSVQINLLTSFATGLLISIIGGMFTKTKGE